MDSNILFNSLKKELNEFLPEYEADQESLTILEHLLDIKRHEILTGTEVNLTEAAERVMSEIVDNRKRRIPLGYILGFTWFYGIKLNLSDGVLIPRQDTEILVERVLETCTSEKAVFLDIGTGSGAVSAGLLENRPAWESVATDISIKAIETASLNCKTRTDFILGDLVSCFKQDTGYFDFIISNPPYIETEAIKALAPEIRDNEPSPALDGGEDGLLFYRTLAAESLSMIKRGGYIFCEIGYTQGDSVRDIFMDSGWWDIKIFKDLGGRDRVIQAQT